jgi:MerR family transcriptional regulator, redox-sensitive transcriptional activator SoxR
MAAMMTDMVTDMVTDMTIGAVARRAGTATSAIRYYEAIGLLPPPARVNGRRRYDASALQRLAVIDRAQQAGFTLGEIRELFFGFVAGTPPAARWEALARRKLADLEAQLTRIRSMQGLLYEGLRCGCLTMEQCTVWLSGLDQTPSIGSVRSTTGSSRRVR